ncbi:MAG: P27 family phage terminase small subunit [Planctomycetia bacterium]|nr:P27 family phage terminase small subunit [Planctomycetia bacterium]
MTRPSKTADPPAHLSPEAAAWWRKVLGDFVFEAHHLKLLQAACEAWDRCQQAREQIATEGLTFNDKHGQPRAHPCVGIERDARIAFARLVRELVLDCEPPTEARPPRLAGARA